MNTNEQCLLNYLFNSNEINSMQKALLNKDYIDATKLLPNGIFVKFNNYSTIMN